MQQTRRHTLQKRHRSANALIHLRERSHLKTGLLLLEQSEREAHCFSDCHPGKIQKRFWHSQRTWKVMPICICCFMVEVEEAFPGPNNSLPSFNECCMYVVDRARTSGAENVNVHFRPMHLACPYCKMEFDIIGKMETFDRDVGYIMKVLNQTVNYLIVL